MAADNVTRLYVGNLLYQIQPEEVENLFVSNQFKVKKIDMSIDPFTGRNPSYCFVDLHTPDDASRAMQTLQGTLIRDRPVKINLKTEKRGPQIRLPTKTYDRGWKPQEVATREVNNDAYVFDRWTRTDAQDHWYAPAEEARRLWVGGLSRVPNQDVVNAEMRDLFQGWRILAVSKLVSPREKWQQAQPGSQYYCFVDFASAQEAKEAAAKLDGKPTPYGGKYKVSIAWQSGQPKRHRERTNVLAERRAATDTKGG